MDTIEEKLQNFLDMYMEDRQKLLAIAVSTETLVAVVSVLHNDLQEGGPRLTFSTLHFKSSALALLTYCNYC